MSAESAVTGLHRWLALVVRYWAVNMTTIHDRDSNWPGFGYTDEEKKELRSIASRVPNREFFWWMAVTVIVALILFGGIVTAGMFGLISVIGGEQNMPNTPEALFFFSLALECVVSLTFGLPAAMLLGAAVIGKGFRIPPEALSDAATTAHYFHKMWFQITRMCLVMLTVVVPLWIFVPADSKFMALTRVAAPILSPLVSTLTSMYYFSTRLRKQAT